MPVNRNTKKQTTNSSKAGKSKRESKPKAKPKTTSKPKAKSKTQSKPKTQPKSTTQQSKALKPTAKPETKGRKPEPKSQAKIKSSGTFGSNWTKDENAKYKQYQPEKLTPEMFEELTSNKKNKWAKSIQNKQFKYDSKLLDPEYAAQYAVKKGNKAFVGDVNADGVDDVLIASKGKKIKAYNGHVPKKSKQEQYMRYYKDGGVKVGSDGEAVFGDKKDFKAWLAMTAQNLDANGTKSKINKELAKQGFSGYKVKEKTFIESIKAQIKPFYDNNIGLVANRIGKTVSDINKVMNYTKFVSIYIRTILNSLFNINPATPSDSMEARIINKALKKKWLPETGFSDIANQVNLVFGDITTTNLNNSILLILEGIVHGAPTEQIQTVLANKLVETFGNKFENISRMCSAATNEIVNESRMNPTA